MAEVDFSLMFEMIKDIHADVTSTKRDVIDMKDSLIHTREEVHALSGHMINLDRRLAEVEVKIDRLHVRTGLVDA
jgi:regulator of replication initiation timing